MKTYNKILCIAGSDSGGGAGIQADIKSISANGGFATTAITAVTAQNTLGVNSIFPIPVESIKDQIIAVLSDIGTDAVKIGMLHSSEVIQAVSEIVDNYKLKNIVLDPVMVATSGDQLLETDAIECLMQSLLPKARIITPNIPEAELLLRKKITSTKLVESAILLAEKFQVSVLLKAGHLKTNLLNDVLYCFEQKKISEFKNHKIDTKNTHGTGCSLSASLATYLGEGLTLEEATSKSIEYIHQAIASGAKYKLGKGRAPINHFHYQ